jgi:hypothetical protein
MRRYRVTMVLAGAAAVLCAAPLAAAAAPAGTWQTAIKVPGLGALNTGVHAFVLSVSCASAGNCAVGGYYTDSANHEQAWVASESNGTWHTAIEVPGTAAFNGGFSLGSVSCGSAGNCAAGGSYYDSSDHFQAFVASES